MASSTEGIPVPQSSCFWEGVSYLSAEGRGSELGAAWRTSDTTSPVLTSWVPGPQKEPLSDTSVTALPWL